MTMREQFFSLLILGVVVILVGAEDFAFINPPPSNVFTGSSDFPVYTQGSTIEIIWTANSSFDPITIALRASVDGILQPSSGIQGAILCMFLFAWLLKRWVPPSGITFC